LYPPDSSSLHLIDIGSWKGSEEYSEHRGKYFLKSKCLVENCFKDFERGASDQSAKFSFRTSPQEGFLNLVMGYTPIVEQLPYTSIPYHKLLLFVNDEVEKLVYVIQIFSLKIDNFISSESILMLLSGIL